MFLNRRTKRSICFLSFRVKTCGMDFQRTYFRFICRFSEVFADDQSFRILVQKFAVNLITLFTEMESFLTDMFSPNIAIVNKFYIMLGKMGVEVTYHQHSFPIVCTRCWLGENDLTIRKSFQNFALQC